MSSIISKTKIIFILFAGISLCALFVFAQPSFEVAPFSGPTIQNTTMPVTLGPEKTIFTIIAEVSDISGVASVIAHIQNPDESDVAMVTFYDDGAHSDGAANDGTFGNSWDSTGKPVATYFVDIFANDMLGYFSEQENGASFDIISACADTCASLGYECGTQTVCGSPIDCGSCIAPKICNASGQCTVPACTDDCAIGEFGCMGLNSEWACGEAGDGDSCLDKVITACNAGETCNVATGVCEIACTDTCVSLGYECGTQTVCGSPTNCGSCTLPATCNAVGKCVVVSNLSATITKPENNTEYTQGDFINFEGIVLGGVPDYDYEWSSNHDGIFNSGTWNGMGHLMGWTNTLSANIHTITLKITDGNTDTVTDSITVIVQPTGTLTTQIDMWKTEFADGETIWFNANVSGGTSPYTFVWNSNHEGNFATGQWPSVDTSVTPWTLGTHTITVTVTDSASNIATDTIDIDITEMTVDIHPKDGEHFIFSNSIWFDAQVSGGTMPYTFSWVSDLDGVIGTTDMFNRDDLQQGIHTITVTITDSTPITIIKTFRIQIDPPPILAITIDNPSNNSTFNQGDDISFNGSYTGGMSPYVFTWTSNIDGNIYTHNSNPDFTKNNLSVGTHAITLTATDNSGQTATDAITIIINPASSLTAAINSPNNGDIFLKIDDVIDFDGLASGGVSPYTYQWSSNQDGDITPTEDPKDKFFKNNLSVNNHTITFTITDSVGATATDSVNITVNANCSSNNVKNNAKYTAKETFLIADTNWRDVLRLVPLAIWNDGGTIHKHPALIYHYETNTKFDADSTIHFMQMYDSSHLTTIGNIPANLNNLFIAAEPVGAGINAGNISNINTSDYFSYWSTIDSLVVVDYNDYKTGLMASVFASHKNSPIIFVNSANLAVYQAMINGKTIYTVGNLDGATQGYISANAGCEVNYLLEEMQKWYSTETNSDKLILVNPGDLNIEANVNFIPEKSAQISHLLGNISLTAPFLASARKEVISFTELSDSGLNGGCSDSPTITANIAIADTDTAYAIQNLFSVIPKYLTIISAPKAIPDSEYVNCNGFWQYRDGVDWKYGSLSDIIWNKELKVGRIYGLTVSDASSYITISLNFDYLNNKIYNGNYSGISVGHCFHEACNFAKTIRDKTVASGYNSICFTDISMANCTIDTKPAFNNYQLKNYIVFLDHGAPTTWCGTIDYDEIPWFDLPVTIGAACLTSNFWQSGPGHRMNFGLNAIRKGAIAYIGSVGITGSNMFDVAEWCIKNLGQDSSLTLGKMHQDSVGAIEDYPLFGDPALQPKFKSITW